MATVPITNSYGEVAYGAAVPVEVESFTKDILAGMRQKQAQEDEAIREAQKQKRAHEEKLNKYKNELHRMVITEDKGIWKGYTPKVKALAYDMFKTMEDGMRDSPNTYDPFSDKKLFEAEHNFSRGVDEFQQGTKTMTAQMAIALDPKKRDTYDINDRALKAWQAGDEAEFNKGIAESLYGDESRAKEIGTYAGAGFLKAIDTTDVIAKTIAAASNVKVPIRDVDLGGGKYKKTQQLSPEEKEREYQTWMLSDGGRLKKALIAQGEAGDPMFTFKTDVDKALKTEFISNIKDNVDLSGGGGQGPRSYEEKNAEKFKFTTPELYKRPSTGDFSLSTINKIGGGALSSDFYSNNNSQSVLGRPTGRIKKYEKDGKVVLEIAVPNVKSLSLPPDWAEMDEQEKAAWTNQQYEQDPNKFTLEEIPLAGANKDKFEASFGRSVEDIFSGTQTASVEKPTTESKRKKYNSKTGKIE